jgi:hypothetical protein
LVPGPIDPITQRWVVLGRALVDDVAGDARAGLGELLDPVLDAIFREVGKVGAERVRLTAVDAGQSR